MAHKKLPSLKQIHEPDKTSYRIDSYRTRKDAKSTGSPNMIHNKWRNMRFLIQACNECHILFHEHSSGTNKKDSTLAASGRKYNKYDAKEIRKLHAHRQNAIRIHPAETTSKIVPHMTDLLSLLKCVNI